MSADRQGPLRDVRVLELAGLGPGPFAGMLLADLGADVLRIDKPEAEWRFAHDALGRGRPTLTLDLKRPEGVETALALVERADALIEPFRPGVMERLGLGPAECLARNPRLVYGRMTGWGQEGPLARSPGHDLNYIGLSGALASIGPAGGRPVPPLNLAGDFGGGGALLALGVVSAVLEARASGEGQVVDAAMIDGSALLLTMFYDARRQGLWRDERGTNLLDGGAPFYDAYTTADGGTVAVACLEPKFYAELLRLLDLDDPALANHLDPETWPAIREALTAAFAARTREECERLFAGAETCVTPVLGLDEAPHHPAAAARDAFYDDGGGPLPRPAPRFSRTQAAAPKPGWEATDADLARWGLGAG